MTRTPRKASTIIIADPDLIRQLESSEDFIMFRDPNGRLINVVTLRLLGSPSPEFLAKNPGMTGEELEESRKDLRGSKTYEEVMAEFRAGTLCTK